MPLHPQSPENRNNPKKEIGGINVLICMQESEPNDRKIGKLCEYASKNPLRIPKVCFIFWLTNTPLL